LNPLPGVTALLKIRCPHAAEHVMLECLAESLWHGQRDGRLPDDQAYLACLKSRGTG